MKLHIAPNFSPQPGILSKERELAIKFENIAVQYRIPGDRAATMKEFAIRLLAGKLQYSDYFALQEISFDVGKGEILGVIGKNGAGKSTLLKLAARVLRPTEGRVWVKGHASALLNISAGFHPELTGRENVFLNGALLGMSRSDLRARFTEIVDFAGLRDFIDAPLRMYSSGMIARLGFAVATDMEPDVLLIDEILGVGDESFRSKCEKRIRRFRDRGTTILLATHNMMAVRELCNRAIWLEQGRIRLLASAAQAASQYEAACK